MSDTLSTADVGITPNNTAFVYANGQVTQVPKGSTVTYGPWVTIQAGDALPNTALVIIEIQGSGEAQAANSGFIRTVTLTPLV